MSTHGFPPRQKLENPASVDQETLRALADQGVLFAKGLLGSVLLEEGRVDKGLSYLYYAKDHGSIYALYRLSEWYRSEANPNPRPMRSAAYLRIAWLLGDRKASDFAYAAFPETDSGWWAMVDRDAAAFFRRLRHRQAGEPGGALPIMPRPDPEEDAYLKDFR